MFGLYKGYRIVGFDPLYLLIGYDHTPLTLIITMPNYSYHVVDVDSLCYVMPYTMLLNLCHSDIHLWHSFVFLGQWPMRKYVRNKLKEGYSIGNQISPILSYFSNVA